jgi:hypothetical protein
MGHVVHGDSDRGGPRVLLARAWFPATSPKLLALLAMALVAPGGHGKSVMVHDPLLWRIHLTACNRPDRSQACPTAVVPASSMARASAPPPKEGSVVNVAIWAVWLPWGFPCVIPETATVLRNTAMHAIPLLMLTMTSSIQDSDLLSRAFGRPLNE